MQAVFREILKNIVLCGGLMGVWTVLIKLSANTGINGFSWRLLLITMLVVLGRYFYRSERLYLKLIGSLTAVALSVLYIGFKAEISMPWGLIADSITFILSIAAVAATVPNCFNKGYQRILAAVPLWGVVFLLASIFWLYYFAEGSWLSGNAILAIMQTNFSESAEYVKIHFSAAGIIGILILASLFGYLAHDVKQNGGIKASNSKIKLLLVIFVLYNTTIVGNIFIKNLWTGPFINAYRSLEEYNIFRAQKEQRQININPAMITADNENGLYVLAIGESETRKHMSAYGYAKPTTPWLTEMANSGQALLFTKAYANYTHTVQALAYALTAKNQYNDMEVAKAVSLVDVAKAAGYKVIWLSNQEHYGIYDTPTSVIADAADQQIFINHTVDGMGRTTDLYDESLVKELSRAGINNKTLLIVHFMGCHGGYNSRYPYDKAIFGRADDVECYDNAVHYNDWVMENLYDKLKSVPNFKGLVYFSDHGEAVEEKLGHNSDQFRPVMAKIPLYMIFSAAYKQEHSDRYQNLLQSVDKTFTNDLIYDTMLGIMGIHYQGHDERQNDLTSPYYDSNMDRFKTLYGKINIKDIGD